jgi:hypothetical protein
MPRAMYGGDAAGTLVTFKVGQAHKLLLRSNYVPSGVAVLDAFEGGHGTRYWVLRAP